MSEIDARREEVGKWIAYARADMTEAKLNIRYGGEPHLACYHAQQAAEKIIKAAYVSINVSFERSHDLDRLRNLLPGTWQFKESFPDLSALTFWAVQGRYPGDFPMATESEASDALILAENLMREVTNDINRQLDA